LLSEDRNRCEDNEQEAMGEKTSKGERIDYCRNSQGRREKVMYMIQTTWRTVTKILLHTSVSFFLELIISAEDDITMFL
jgi:hypothetical protein